MRPECAVRCNACRAGGLAEIPRRRVASLDSPAKPTSGNPGPRKLSCHHSGTAVPTYTRIVRVSFEARNLVCLVGLPPNAFDFQRLEDEFNLEQPETRLSTPQAAAAQYAHFGILVAGGRVQFDPAATADEEVVRGVAAHLLQVVDPYRPTGVGFNGLARVEADEGENPVAALVDISEFAGRLDASGGEAGAKLVYPQSEGLTTFSIDPQEGNDRVWLSSVNRHYDGLPDETELAEVLDWFSTLDAGFVAQVETVVSAAETTP
jgi:hypothetical protein